MKSVEPTATMAEFVKKFIEANPTLGQEVKDDIDEIEGEMYVILAEDQWGKKQRRTGRVIELLLNEQDGACTLVITVTTEHLMEFDLRHLRWNPADGWTARAQRKEDPIELKTFMIEFE